MQERNDSFEELRANLLEKLRNQGCSPITITGYRYQCNSIFKWMRRNDYDHYSVEGGNKYLQDYCAKHGENQYYTTLRTVIYRLVELSIKMGNFDEAADYYKQFVEISPNDNSRYILKYKLARAKRAPLEEQISILKEYKSREYTERWAYELARLYAKAGKKEACIEECDDLILWFSEGKYVYKAMELKMRYKPLTPLQQEKYDRRLEEAEKSSEREAEKLIDLGRIKAEEEEKRRREQEEAARYTEDMLERSEQIAESENVELSEEEVAEQLKKAEPPKKKLGDTMKLGEALQNLFHTEKEEAQEQEELERFRRGCGRVRRRHRGIDRRGRRTGGR